ncbi:MAG: hypothetical protein ACREES_08885, partial [Stellaceae bacterium]
KDQHHQVIDRVTDVEEGGGDAGLAHGAAHVAAESGLDVSAPGSCTLTKVSHNLSQNSHDPLRPS